MAQFGARREGGANSNRSGGRTGLNFAFPLPLSLPRIPRIAAGVRSRLQNSQKTETKHVAADGVALARRSYLMRKSVFSVTNYIIFLSSHILGITPIPHPQHKRNSFPISHCVLYPPLIQSIPKKDLQGFQFHVSHIPPTS